MQCFLQAVPLNPKLFDLSTQIGNISTSMGDEFVISHSLAGVTIAVLAVLIMTLMPYAPSS